MPGKRQWAIRGLVRYRDLDPTILVEIASNLRRKVRQAHWYFDAEVARSLGELGSAGRSAIPAMLEVLRSDTTLHLANLQILIESLGKISADQAVVIPVLLEHLGHVSVHIAKAARSAVLGYGQAAIPVLEAIAQGDQGDQASRAAGARELLAALGIR